MSNRKSKLASKFSHGKWHDSENSTDFENIFIEQYSGKLPVRFVLKTIELVYAGRIEYDQINSDEKLSNFIFQILHNPEYGTKFFYSNNVLEELKLNWKLLSNDGKFRTVRNITFKLK